MQDLVNKDTDGDGIPDWEEGLYGLDPLKKETTPGTLDNIAIEKLKTQKTVGINGQINAVNQPTENLTQTDKFSRELFATVAAASQNGTMDQTTIDQLGASLAEKIENPVVKKVFLILDIKIINDNSFQAFTSYNNTLNSIYEKYQMNYTVLDVLQKFAIDENNVDVSALTKLDPIIEQTKKIIDAMVKMSVPQSLSTLHLNVVNRLQMLVENLNDIKLYESDAIVALGGASKYLENAPKLESDLNNLVNAIDQKLSQ